MPELNIHRSEVALFHEHGKVIAEKEMKKGKKRNMRKEAKGKLNY